jgi:hypothetical protein
MLTTGHCSSVLTGAFIEADGQTWYRIDHPDSAPPFFMTLAGDSDLWAFLSSNGSLTAGRHDAEGAFLPYETVDRIHLRWEHTGPRTWIRILDGEQATLWQPFAPRLAGGSGSRSVWKNLSGSRIRLREVHAGGQLAFEQEWAGAGALGLVRTARLQWLGGAGSSAPALQVLDGVLNLVPPGVSVLHAATMGCLTDAYKWNELAAGGRLGLFTLYAQIWDRAEPKESFHALAAWHSGLPAGARSLLSANQLEAFCQTGEVQAETLTRGRRGAWLARFDVPAGSTRLQWHQVLDGPKSQVQAFALAQWLDAGGGTPPEIHQALAANDAGLDELLARADGLQTSADTMAAAHHRANVLFNIMRGGVFVDGTRFDRDDLLAFLQQRNRAVAALLRPALAGGPATLERGAALTMARAAGPQAERLVLGYLPLTFSRRHGDPSRPWNKFSIRVRDAAGRRVVSYEGNWRDIFQNWEALLPSCPAYAGSMIATFLSAMTPDGHNPYRISRAGIDWERPEADNPWSHIGYWGDHQVVYLLRLLEAAQAHDPQLLAQLWNQALFSFADVPYRLKPHDAQTAQPKHTISFDAAADQRAHALAARIGSDGLLVCDTQGQPVLATLAEKLAIIVLAKAGSLVPGGGLWLHTQRPEWNDANNALVGNGLSVVTLAHLRRLLCFLLALPAAADGFALSPATLRALQGLLALLRQTPLAAIDDAQGRRLYLDSAGRLLDPWRASGYAGAEGRYPAGERAAAPAGLLPDLARALLPLVDASLQGARRGDGLFHSYNLVDLRGGRAEVSTLYPMLEGQVALLSSGLLDPDQAVALLDALFASALFCPRRQSFLLYPDRPLAGFLQRNRLDADALALPVVQQLLADRRTDLLQQQSDGTVRFAPDLANRDDLQAAGADLGPALAPLADAYERVLQHHQFTGRSGTMFGYEGLGCIYWHMVAKLLLAVQEQVFAAADEPHRALPALQAHYRRVRDGLGYRKTAAAYGAFPADPYSHTPGEGGAQQPGMTGQVKEEVLTRWGELGLRMQAGRLRLQPVLMDRSELPPGTPLQFTWRGIPVRYQAGETTALRVQTAAGWLPCPDLQCDLRGVSAIEADIALAPL